MGIHKVLSSREGIAYDGLVVTEKQRVPRIHLDSVVADIDFPIVQHDR